MAAGRVGLVDVDVNVDKQEDAGVDVDGHVDVDVDVDVDEALDVDVDVDKAVDEAVDEVVDVDKGLEVPFNILLIIASPKENKLKIYQFVNIWLWPLRTLVCTFKLLGWEAKKTCSLHLS